MTEAKTYPLTEENNHRCCKTCGVGSLANGFVINGGEEYYCTKECMLKEITEKEFLELYDDGKGDSFWTEWEEGEE